MYFLDTRIKPLTVCFENLGQRTKITSPISSKIAFLSLRMLFFLYFSYETAATALDGKFCVARGNDAQGTTRDTKINRIQFEFPLCILLLCDFNELTISFSEDDPGLRAESSE